MAVVGRIAQANDDRNAALDRQRAGVLFCDRLQEKRWLKWLGIGAFECIGQEDVRALRRQLPAAVAQRAADAQFAHRVGADHLFKAVQIFGQRRSLTGHCARALFGFDAAERVFDNAKQVGAGPDRWDQA